MIYTTGTIAGNGSTITGTGTNFTAAGSLIRVGCTLIAFTNPVQVLQITAVTSGAALSVTPAITPAIAAGTRYAILLSDSLSVDGLAQDIAETFGMYQKYMGGFADVMNGTGDVTITINGQAVTVPGQKSLAKKSELGTAAKKNVGTATGDVVTVGSEQVAYRVNLPALGYSDIGYKGFYGYATLPVDSVAKLSQVLVSNSEWSLGYSFGVYRSVTGTPDTSAFLFCAADGSAFSRNWYFYLNGDAVGPSGKLYSEKNTIRAADGTLKAASPVIKLFTDGHAETNAESEGCTVTRKGTGEYLIEGCIGMNADAAWGGIDGGFDIPKDRNRQPLIWLDYDVNPDGSVLVKTYHRTHPDAPAFARNMIGIKNDDGTFDETVKSGEPIDIPADQFVSVRVEMPENSIYNQKRVAEQAAWKEELRKAEEKALQQDWQREADQK